MIKEIALDPCLFAQWSHHLALRDAFGVEKGRVISAFSRKWKGLVRDEVNRLIAAGLIGDNKGKSILGWLAVPFGTTETRMVTSTAAYDGNKPWHLNAEDNWPSFDAILSNREVTAENAVFADEEFEYLRHAKLSPETQRTIARQRGPIVDCAWPLLRDSKVVKLIEPHFNPHKARFCNVLEALLDRMHAEGSTAREIELHVRHPEDRDPTDRDAPIFTHKELKSKLSSLLRTGWTLKVHLWTRERERMHPRYLLTDRGGIQIDHGWDEGEQATETTPILLLTQTPKLEATDRLEHWLLNASRSLDSILKDAAAADRKALSSQASAPLKHLELRNLGLTQQRWEQEMTRYQLGSPDFAMNPETDIVIID